jgi:hypothetical protein
MSHFPRIVVALAVLSCCAIRADDSSDHPQQPPEEIPDFSHLDEYIYVPKTTLNLGFRFIVVGPKTTFSGQGVIPAPEDPGSSTVANVSHTYHDGTVNPDARTVTVDDGNGGTSTQSVPSDGKTNSWSYTNQSQLTSDGDIAFHTYSAVTNDTLFHTANGDANAGIELVATREMGKLGKHLQWNLTAGFSITDVRSATWANVPANITTVTDTYDLFGQIPPAAPYTSPGTTSQNVVNSSGAIVTSGVTTTTVGTTTTTTSTDVTQSVDQTTLLGNIPLGETTGTELNTTEVMNRYSIEGAYYTFRAGPSLIWQIGSHIDLSLSAGVAVIYSGTDFMVEEFFTPDTGSPIVEYFGKENTHLLPGYYADLTLQYHLTDTAGFYLGALYEGAGSYTQSVSAVDTISGEPTLSASPTSYTTRINFDNQTGVRAGMTVKF